MIHEVYDKFTQTINKPIWICPRCSEELGELNGYCVYCKVNDAVVVYNPDKYFIRDIRIYHITHRATGGSEMTPQEELFSQLFNHEKLLVRDMEILQLRAHREELAKIAFEARARLTAVDDEENNRKKKNSNISESRGFERSLNADDVSSEAINTIKERQKKLTGKEKIRAGLIALYSKGMTLAEAEKTADIALRAGTILAKLEDKKSKNIILGNETRSPLSQTNGFVIQKSSEEFSKTNKSISSIFNPFEKKEGK